VFRWQIQCVQIYFILSLHYYRVEKKSLLDIRDAVFTHNQGRLISTEEANVVLKNIHSEENICQLCFNLGSAVANVDNMTIISYRSPRHMQFYFDAMFRSSTIKKCIYILVRLPGTFTNIIHRRRTSTSTCRKYNNINPKAKIPGIHIPVFTFEFTSPKSTISGEISLSCPNGYWPQNKHDGDEFLIECGRCGYNTYSFKKEISIQYNVSRIIGKRLKTQTSQKCNTCPAGGNCTLLTLKSMDDYYGQSSKGSINFIPCSNSYCCSERGKKCLNHTSSNYNRHGVLCGACNQGYYESYFSSKCVSNSKCVKVNNGDFGWSSVEVLYFS